MFQEVFKLVYIYWRMIKFSFISFENDEDVYCDNNTPQGLSRWVVVLFIYH